MVEENKMSIELNDPGRQSNGGAVHSLVSTENRKDGIDMARAQFAVRELLLAIGENPDREGLQDTPLRVAKSMVEFYGGLHEDPRDHLRKVYN